jgi:hypothetical protein
MSALCGACGRPAHTAFTCPEGERAPRPVRYSRCEMRTKLGHTCPNKGLFFVHVRTVPQMLRLPDGTGTMEVDPAGRSLSVCPAHLGPAVRDLYELDIRAFGARVEVSPQ